MSMDNPTNVAASERATAAAFEIKGKAALRENKPEEAEDAFKCAAIAMKQAERLEAAA